MLLMSGKTIGLILGAFFAGPWGGLVGLILGFLYDRSQQRHATNRRKSFHTDGVAASQIPFPVGLNDNLQKSTYLIGIIVLSAKMAKADGRVSREEINAFRSVFHIPDSEVAQVGNLFDQARETASGYEPYAARMAQVFRFNPAILEEILSGLFRVALADSRALSRPEDLFLRRVALIFGFTQADFVRIAARSGVHLASEGANQGSRTNAGGGAHPQRPADDSYVVLGLPEDASDDMIKRTYRALIRKHHPDKLLAAGLPPELIAQATEKMKRINAAYATICKKRGIK